MSHQRTSKGAASGGATGSPSYKNGNSIDALVIVPDAEIHSMDILMGRGARMIRHAGNVRFRAVVEKRKGDYNQVGTHRAKQGIAQEILREITTRHNGRFLRKLNEFETKKLGTARDAWVLANPAAVMEKVKQTLRDRAGQTSKAELNENGRSLNVKDSVPTPLLQPTLTTEPSTNSTVDLSMSPGPNNALEHLQHIIDMLSLQERFNQQLERDLSLRQNLCMLLLLQHQQLAGAIYHCHGPSVRPMTTSC